MIDETLRDVLSPKSLAVLEGVQALQSVGTRYAESVDAVREEALSPDSDVWACADGQGFIQAIMIDDDALSGRYTLEELEDAISDVMIDASGRGQAAGEQLSRAFMARLDALMKDVS
ncbi:hypothetical protein MAHJHV58_00190 [Mycobacterium avium subsp. hominissuis]|uniref:hypothetical protein n=1 Tax=Mycobacterium avium TaxID=1764 RepID=UPI0004451C7C|nr:hypothetical protein [Mycobacterium avium]ETZ55295.1 hypothetical protein L838_0951 [Mycobacterium avium MAV_120709_2344]MCA4736664.1 hypothetical protein [Mycobacterium avium subsp. hominissuis]MCA4741243.1 hypothetical protein [Mycobacterium avium subsp. hominissuis]MCA4745952.1 hypothetical protein [Mycobacterium avium subsp. hominissuis]MCA4766116.1 hypothetical protein [Mycobacterium avium subsp. hominissuis]